MPSFLAQMEETLSMATGKEILPLKCRQGTQSNPFMSMLRDYSRARRREKSSPKNTTSAACRTLTCESLGRTLPFPILVPSPAHSCPNPPGHGWKKDPAVSPSLPCTNDRIILYKTQDIIGQIQLKSSSCLTSSPSLHSGSLYR